MNRIITLTVGQNCLVRDILRKSFSHAQAVKLKESGGITLNGKILRADSPLNVGDRVNFSFEAEPCKFIPKADYDLAPLYEDDDYIVLDKGRGICCMPINKKSVFDCLTGGRVITRLDKDTCGLVLVAKSSVAASVLNGQKIYKEYLCLADGKIDGEVTVSAPISRAGDIRRIVDFTCGKPSVTQFIPVDFIGKYTLCRCVPLTGRTHQIRLHAAYIGHPIAGDTLYGNGTGEYNSGQQLLCPKIEFINPISGLAVSVASKRNLPV